MEYQVGRQGRVVIAKFDDNDDVLDGIHDIVKSENIRSGVFFLIGGMKEGRFVVGPEKETLPPVPMWREMNESHEIFGTGTVFWDDKTPKIHFHGAYAKGDDVKGGCLREHSRAFLIIEAVIIEIEGVDATRKMDRNIGVPLLHLRSRPH